MSDISYDSDSFFSVSSVSEGSSEISFQSIHSLNDCLSSHLSPFPKNFNVVHINAQSIPAHYPDLLSSFENTNAHAILISESWLKPCLPSIAYSLPGFQLIRNDRTVRNGGGVAIYLRAHIPFTVLNYSQYDASDAAGPEHLFIELMFSHTKILLGVYYSPSLTVDYFESLEILLERLTPSYEHSVIMGDFNTCLLKNDSRAGRLKAVINSTNMHILPLSSTHSFPNCTPSLLDLILVSSIDHVELHGQCNAAAFSYHDLIFLSYKVKPPKAKSRILLQRNFTGMDLERLREDAEKIKWNMVYEQSTIELQVSVFNSLIIQLYDTHAPIRPVRVKHLPAPWLTDGIKKLQEKKNNAKTKYKNDSSDINREKYVKARNRCNRVCRDNQRRHIHKSVVEEDNPEKVWNFLRTLGVGKAKQNTYPCNLDLNKLNKHFSPSVTIDVATKLSSQNQIRALPTPKNPNFNFAQFTESDVKENILAITSDAVGYDCISRKMIIPILDILIPILTTILNFSINTCTFPTSWKEAQLIPLPKNRNPSTMSDYRPISILPFLSKVLERLVNQQFSKYLTSNNLFNPFQSGFRPGHSTTTALVNVSDDIRLGMENHQVTLMILIDFSNAFNTVDFDILLAIMYSLNISPKVIDWFHSYLHGRKQRIRIQESYSEWCPVLAGVPQGGVLSPLLFSLFINYFCHKLASPYHLYADDLQIYRQCSLHDLTNAITTLSQELTNISIRSKSLGLVINPKKSQAIIIGSPRLICQIPLNDLPNISIDGVIIPFTEKVKNLGIIFDQHLSWKPQISELSRKLFSSIASLRRLRNFLPIPTKVALAQSLLLPILDYADCCYLDLKEEQLNKLERLQNICIRFIFGLRKYDHISEFRTKLKWLPIRLRRNTHVLCLLYNILFNQFSPSYLKERFKFLCELHDLSLRSKNTLSLKIPCHSSSFYTNSFAVKSVRLWNSLPITVRQAKTLKTFKKRLKEYYMTLES